MVHNPSNNRAPNGIKLMIISLHFFELSFMPLKEAYV